MGVISGVRALQQCDVVTARSQELREFATKLASGEICQTPHLIQGLVGRPGCDQTMHSAEVGGKCCSESGLYAVGGRENRLKTELRTDSAKLIGLFMRPLR